jgi:hypothetical protein
MTMRKSDDWGATWTTEDDATFTALTNVIASADSYERNDYIHVATQENTTGRVAYHRFNKTTDSWDIFDEEVTASCDATFFSVSICTTVPTQSYLPDGKPVIYYSGDRITVSGTKRTRGYYKERYAVNVWGNGDAADTTETQVTNLGQIAAPWLGTVQGTAVNMNPSRVIPGTDDRLQFFWTSQGSFKGEFHRTRPTGTKTLGTTLQWLYGNLLYSAVVATDNNMGKYDWYQSPIAPYNVTYAFGFKAWGGDAYWVSHTDSDTPSTPVKNNMGMGDVWEGSNNAIENGGYPAISIGTSVNSSSNVPMRHWAGVPLIYFEHWLVYKYSDGATPAGADYRAGFTMDFNGEGSIQQANSSFADHNGDKYILSFECLDYGGPHVVFEKYKLWNQDGTIGDLPAPYLSKTNLLTLL